MIRRSRSTHSEQAGRRHRGARRSAWAWLVAPGHRAGAIAVGGTLVLVGLLVMVGLAGSTSRFTPLPLPQAGDSGTGADGVPSTGHRASPPDPRATTASSSPTPLTDAPSSSTSSRTAAVQSATPSPSPRSEQPTPSSPPSTLDTSVKHPAHHGKPAWSGGEPHADKPGVSP